MGRQSLHKVSLLVCEDIWRLKVDHNESKVKEEDGGKVERIKVDHDEVKCIL